MAMPVAVDALSPLELRLRAAFKKTDSIEF